MKRILPLIITSIIIIPPILFAQPDTLWTTSFGWSFQEYPNSDKGTTVIETTENEYIIAGYSHAALLDAYWPLLVKTDNNGDSLWLKSYSFQSYGAFVNDAIQTSDGGYILTGGTVCLGLEDYLFLLRTDENGDTLWMQTYGGDQPDEGFSVCETEEGGFIAVGATLSTPSSGADIYLVRTDPSGYLHWERTYGGYYYIGKDIIITEDHGFIVLASAQQGIYDNTDIYLMRLNFTGDTLWTKTYYDEYNASPQEIIPTSDGNYIIVSTIYCPESDTEAIYLIKTDQDGDSLWTRLHDSSLHNEKACSITLIDDGGYLICGSINPGLNFSFDLYLLKVDSCGNYEWDLTFGGNSSDFGYDAIQTSDGYYLVTGSSYSINNSDAEIWLLKVDSEGTSVDDENCSCPHTFNMGCPYPNPFNSSTKFEFEIPGPGKIDLSIYDLNGRKVASIVDDNQFEGQRSFEWEPDNNISSGIYFICLTSSQIGTLTHKIVYLK